MLLFPFFLHSHNTNMTSIYSNIEFPSTKVMISTVASAAGTIMIVRSFARDYVPSELQHYVSTKFHNFLSTFSNEATFLIEEYDGLEKNHLFDAAELHVSTIASPSTTRTYRAKLPEKEKKIHISLGGNEEITEKFRGMVVNWRLMKEKVQPRHIYNPNTYRSNMVSEVRYLRLSFHKKHYQKIVDDYLPYVLESSKSFKERKKTVKLYTLKNDGVHGPGINPWQSVNLDHPSKFETLAMDDEMKKMIIGDLDLFVRRKEFYRKVGKAWKRGYLLFGPPGTGKSSLIAAMANYLNFDVYDLELTDIRSDAELRRLLISTANRSILVVEDIDASIDLSERKKKKRAARPGPPDMYLFHEQRPTVSLSGLLNFVDGLWSSIGDERIIIFTTNHKDKLDPALLRPGRMDMHINMSYCTPCGFKLLANNYLGITEHPLILKAQELIASSKITPAEIGEQLLKREDPELALCGLIDFINDKREEEEKGAKEDVKEEETQDGIGELIKITQEESLKEMDGKMIKRHEAIDALKILAGFLQQEFPTGKTNVVDSQESAKENGSKNE